MKTTFKTLCAALSVAFTLAASVSYGYVQFDSVTHNTGTQDTYAQLYDGDLGPSYATVPSGICSEIEVLFYNPDTGRGQAEAVLDSDNPVGTYYIGYFFEGSDCYAVLD
jgi:hypothetical protein